MRLFACVFHPPVPAAVVPSSGYIAGYAFNYSSTIPMRVVPNDGGWHLIGASCTPSTGVVSLWLDGALVFNQSVGSAGTSFPSPGARTLIPTLFSSTVRIALLASFVLSASLPVCAITGVQEEYLLTSYLGSDCCEPDTLQTLEPINGVTLPVCRVVLVCL